MKDGRVQENVNGSLRSTYVSGLVDAATDGTIVAAVNKDGRVMKYVKAAYGELTAAMWCGSGSAEALSLPISRAAAQRNTSTAACAALSR
jgi:hypothetical protein